MKKILAAVFLLWLACIQGGAEQSAPGKGYPFYECRHGPVDGVDCIVCATGRGDGGIAITCDWNRR